MMKRDQLKVLESEYAAYKRGWEKEVEFPQQIVGGSWTINI